MRGELSSVWRMFLSAAEAKSVSPTRALCRLLNVTNLDRKPELGRYSGMWAESQNEDQSPLAQGALVRTATFSAA